MLKQKGDAMKIVRCMTVLALFVAVPMVCGKNKVAKPDKEDYTTAVAPIPVTDEKGNPPMSMGVEGENYRTAVGSIPAKAAKQKKVIKEEAPVDEYKIKAKKTKAVKPEKKPEVITAKVNETFTIELPASPKLERSWKLYKKLSAKVSQVGEPKFIKGEKGDKYEGTMVYTFKAIKPGTATIKMKKLYPKGLKKPLKLKAFTIEIAK